MASASRHRRVFMPVLAVLVGLAWIALWAWARSPYGRTWTTATGRHRPGGVDLPRDPRRHVHRSGSDVGRGMDADDHGNDAAHHPAAVRRFPPDRRRAGRPARLLVLLALGYMAAWGGFGLLAMACTRCCCRGGQRARARVARLADRRSDDRAGRCIPVQQLKHRCLEKCRTPLSFVIEHWRGRDHARQAFALGAHHGLFCVGCCWALMLLMFAVGAGSLGWMLVLAAVMAIEKNFPGEGAERTARPRAAGLVGAAGASNV